MPVIIIAQLSNCSLLSMFI